MKMKKMTNLEPRESGRNEQEQPLKPFITNRIQSHTHWCQIIIIPYEDFASNPPSFV